MGTCGCIMHRANHGIWQMDCCPPCPGWTSKSHYSFDSIGALRAELGFLLRSIIDMSVGIEERTEGEVSSLLAVGRGGRVGPSKHGEGAGMSGDGQSLTVLSWDYRLDSPLGEGTASFAGGWAGHASSILMC